MEENINKSLFLFSHILCGCSRTIVTQRDPEIQNRSRPQPRPRPLGIYTTTITHHCIALSQLRRVRRTPLVTIIIIQYHFYNGHHLEVEGVR